MEISEKSVNFGVLGLVVWFSSFLEHSHHPGSITVVWHAESFVDRGDQATKIYFYNDQSEKNRCLSINKSLWPYPSTQRKGW